MGHLVFHTNVFDNDSYQPVLHDWYNKTRGMCYPVCGMVHIKEPLLLIGKSSGFPLTIRVVFTICPTPYNRKIKCVECVVKLNTSFFNSMCRVRF